MIKRYRILAATLILLLLTGCGIPKTMPKATVWPPKKVDPGYGDPMDSPQYKEFLNPPSPGSLYRVTVDRRLSEKEAQRIQSDATEGPPCFYYQGTLWYDYLADEPCKITVYIPVIGTPDDPVEPTYAVGATYIMLIRQGDGADGATSYSGFSGIFPVHRVAGKEYGFTYLREFEELSEIETDLSATGAAPSYYDYRQCFELDVLIERLVQDLKEHWDYLNPKSASGTSEPAAVPSGDRVPSDPKTLYDAYFSENREPTYSENLIK